MSLTICSLPHICHCGTATKNPHETGKDGCDRYMTPAPEPLGTDPDTGFDMWIIDGHLITEYTLLHQRGYHHFECGCWSRWQGSVNSLPDET